MSSISLADDSIENLVTWEGQNVETFVQGNANISRLTFTHKSVNVTILFYFEFSNTVHATKLIHSRSRKSIVVAPNAVKWGLQVIPVGGITDPIAQVVLNVSHLTQLREYCADRKVCPRPYDTNLQTGDGILEHLGAFFSWDSAVTINGNNAPVDATFTSELHIAGASHTSIRFTLGATDPIQELDWDPMIGVGGTIDISMESMSQNLVTIQVPKVQGVG